MMLSKVLILNYDYRAMSVCSIERAFLLIFLQKAERVNDVDGEFLRTVTSSYPVPSVIRLSRYVNVPFKSVEMTRSNIIRRDGGKCGYCGSKINLTLDHILPKSRGGKSNWQNLVTACSKCNLRIVENYMVDILFMFRYMITIEI